MVKRFEEETYMAKIGVNRGAGFTSAAASARRQAGDIEEIFTQYSNDLLKEAIDKGKKRGQKSANEQEILFETIINADGEEVSIPKKPIKPADLAGKSALEVYDQLSTERYLEELTTSTSQVIDKYATDAELNGKDEALFANQATKELETIYKNVDPTIRQLLKMKDRAYMQNKGKYVNESFLKNTYQKGKANFIDFNNNQNREFTRDILYGTANTEEHYTNINNRLEKQHESKEISDINYNDAKEILSIQKEADSIFIEKFKKFLPYEIGEQNNSAEANSKALFDFFNIDNKETEVELIVNGNKKTFTRQELEKGLNAKQIEFIRENRIKPFNSSVQQSNAYSKGMVTLEEILKSKNYANTVPATKKHDATSNAGPDGQELIFDYFIKDVVNANDGVVNGAPMSTDYNNMDGYTRVEFIKYKIVNGLLSNQEINTLENVINNNDVEGIIKNQVLLKLINEKGALDIHLSKNAAQKASDLIGQALGETDPRSKIEDFYANEKLMNEKNMPQDLAQNYKMQQDEDYNSVAKVSDKVYELLDEMSTEEAGKSVYFGTLAFNKIMSEVHRKVRKGYVMNDSTIYKIVQSKYEGLSAHPDFGFSEIALPFERVLPRGDLDDTTTFVKHPPEKLNPVAFHKDNMEETRKLILDRYKYILGKADNPEAERILKDQRPLDPDNIYLRYRVNPNGSQEYVIYYISEDDNPLSRSFNGEPVTISIADLKEIYNE